MWNTMSDNIVCYHDICFDIIQIVLLDRQKITTNLSLYLSLHSINNVYLVTLYGNLIGIDQVIK